MKLAITRDPPQDFISWDTGRLYPNEIRTALQWAKEVEDIYGIDHKIACLNITALNEFNFAEWGLFHPEHVLVLDNGILKPLLEVKEENWLAHFSLKPYLIERRYENCKRNQNSN